MKMRSQYGHFSCFYSSRHADEESVIIPIYSPELLLTINCLDIQIKSVDSLRKFLSRHSSVANFNRKRFTFNHIKVMLTTFLYVRRVAPRKCTATISKSASGILRMHRIYCKNSFQQFSVLMSPMAHNAFPPITYWLTVVPAKKWKSNPF